jgi:hypothetical protein
MNDFFEILQYILEAGKCYLPSVNLLAVFEKWWKFILVIAYNVAISFLRPDNIFHNRLQQN